jgi:hypothetical protein
MTSLRGQWQSRRAYFESHAAEVERFNLVRRAEQARELQVRTSARLNPPQEIVAVLGPEPDTTTARQAWLTAVETQAVHDERFRGAPAHGPEARWSGMLVDQSVATARATLDVPAAAETELSLL